MKPETPNSRRLFVKKTLITAAAINFFGVNLFADDHKKLVNINHLLLPENDLRVQELMKRYDNKLILSAMSPAEAQGQYNALIKLIGETSKPSFQSLSSEKMTRKLNEVNAFGKESIATKIDHNLTWDSFMEGIEMASVAGSVSSTIYSGAMLMGNALAPALYPLAFSPIIAVPLFLGSAGLTALNVYNLIGNDKRNKIIQNSKTELLVTKLNSNLTKGEAKKLDVKKVLPELALNLNGAKLDPKEVFKPQRNSSPAERNLMNFLKSNVGTTDLLSNPVKFKVFLDNFASAVGEVQQESLESLLNAYQEKKHAELLEQRDKAELASALASFVDLALSGMAAPKEAKIMSILINAGLQYALVGMTPYGWPIVAISIATTLATRSDSQSFEKTTFAMLAQIQRQLDTIIKQLDTIYETQIEILKELKDILKEVIETQNLINQRFDNLSLKQNILYQAIQTNEQNNVGSDLSTLDRRLKNSILDNLTQLNPTNDLLAMKDIALSKFNTKAFTCFDSIPMNAAILKEEIFFKVHNYKYNVSLYRTIGLVPILNAYDPVNDVGQSDKKIIHPIELFNVTKTIINWMMRGIFKPDVKTTIINDLLLQAENSRKILNDVALPENITVKSKSYRQVVDAFILQTRTKLIEAHTNEFLSKPDNRQRIVLRTSIHHPFLDHIDNTIKNGSLPANFMDNRNDDSLLNLAMDLGLLSLKTISSRPFKMDGGSQKIYGKNDVVTDKNNKVIINNVMLDFNSKTRISIEIDYINSLVATEFEYWSAQGAGGRKASKTEAKITYDKNWQNKISKTLLDNQNKKIEDLVPNFAKLDFPQFINHLIDQSLRTVKENRLTSIITNLLPRYNAIDGTGITLMVLSRLNQVITYDNVIPYTIDYFGSLYTRDDFQKLLESIIKTDYENDKALFLLNLQEDAKSDDANLKLVNKLDQNAISLFKSKSFFYIKEQSGYTKLDLNNFFDFVTILLNKLSRETVERVLKDINEVDNNDSEPFLGEVINNLNGYKKVYLD